MPGLDFLFADMKVAKTLTKTTHAVNKQLILQKINEGESEFDFSDVEKVDSTAVSLILIIKREEACVGRKLSILNIPAELNELINLYGLNSVIYDA